MIRAGLGGLCVALLVTAAGAQVTIDGTTNTTVSVGANGAVTVGVAPTTGRDSVSLNRYEQFNVDAAGVALDNRLEAARTIVNEVTGTDTSRLSGPLEVLGQRAHVIVANPNGIVLNGGTFVNTGRVALTTGTIGNFPRQIAPGIFQNNVTATVTGGVITVEGGGLSGQMDAVDLIAHQLRINGPVTNTNDSAGASLRLVGGQSQTEFNSAVLVGNTDLSWGTVTGGGTADDVVIAITRPGALRANRIEIAVTDQGNGVAFAGDGFAGSRGFSLSAAGDVNLTGANITTETGLLISGASLSGGTGAVLSAPEGAVQLRTTSGDADLTGMSASGAQLIFGTASALNITDSQLSIAGDVFATTGGDLNWTGVATEVAGSIVINSAADLRLTGSELNVDGTLQWDAEGALVMASSDGSAFAHVLTTTDRTTLTQSTLVARNGSVIMTTLGNRSDGDLTNEGGLIQGATFTDGLTNTAGTMSMGAVTLDAAGDLTNGNIADAFGVVFGAAGDVHLTAGQTLLNSSGRIVANGDISLTAQEMVRNETANGRANPEITQEVLAGHRLWWTLWLKRAREVVHVYDFGLTEAPTALGTITASGGVSLVAPHVINEGGEINANDGDVQITATLAKNLAIGIGRVAVEKTCTLGCRTTTSGEVGFTGGSINAAGDVLVEASEAFLAQGGQTYAIGNVNISAPDVAVSAGVIPTVVTRKPGLYNFFATGGGWIALRQQMGNLRAETGRVVINSSNPTRTFGGTITAGMDVLFAAGEDTVRAPDAVNLLRRGPIGWLAGLPFL